MHYCNEKFIKIVPQHCIFNFLCLWANKRLINSHWKCSRFIHNDIYIFSQTWNAIISQKIVLYANFFHISLLFTRQLLIIWLLNWRTRKFIFNWYHAKMMTILQNQEETWMLLLLKKCQETVDYIDISEGENIKSTWFLPYLSNTIWKCNNWVFSLLLLQFLWYLRCKST